MTSVIYYISMFKDEFSVDFQLWEIVPKMRDLIIDKIKNLDSDFIIKNEIAIHKTAEVEPNAQIKPPAIIGENCFVAANSLLRGGVFLAKNVTIGPGVELKNVMIFDDSAVAHFNFIGDSVIGSDVNFEAGAIVANHFNERSDKEISLKINDEFFPTKRTKFGSIVGDGSKIGANAVLSPATVLPKNSVVKRLELIEQL